MHRRAINLLHVSITIQNVKMLNVLHAYKVDTTIDASIALDVSYYNIVLIALI